MSLKYIDTFNICLIVWTFERSSHLHLYQHLGNFLELGWPVMVKQDDNHKRVFSGGFSKMNCDIFYFPKMATIISTMSHGLLLNELASPHHKVDSQLPTLGTWAVLSDILQIQCSNFDFTGDGGKVIRSLAVPCWVF